MSSILESQKVMKGKSLTLKTRIEVFQLNKPEVYHVFLIDDTCTLLPPSGVELYLSPAD